MKCPICRSDHFYVKDPEDVYETYPFHCQDGGIHFDSDVEPSAVPPIESGTETYCSQCAWHGKYQELKR